MSLHFAAPFDWIIFDAVGTLIDPDPPVATVYGRVGRRWGSRLTDEEVGRRFQRAFARFEASELRHANPASPHDLRTSEEHERRRWESIVREIFDDLAHPRQVCDELLACFADPAAWRLFPDVLPALTSLQELGVRLGVASNYDERLHGVLEGHGLGSLLLCRAVSSTIGYRKPSRHFFSAVQQRTGSPARRILYVGDDPEHDVTAAREAGFSAMRIVRGALQAIPGALCDLRHLPQLLQMPCPDG